MGWTLPVLPDLQPWQWALGATCALMIGLAKTGVPGLATLTVPLMVFAVGDSRQSAAWAAPMLITGDVFAVWYWRRHAESRTLLSLVPWVAVGMVLGGFALRFDDAVLRRVLGSLVLVMVALTVWRRVRPTTTPGGRASVYGIAAGFATTIANGAGPVMASYLLLKRLSKEQIVATGAWFFFTVNVAKLPIYAANGLLSLRSATFDLVMAPVVVCGALGGFWILRRIPQRGFEVLTLALAVVSAIFLFR